jgi:histone acetyltransferase (RNA polymerase elongator complex component)
MTHVIVPISLGGSIHRGVFSPPVREETLLDTLPALIDYYLEQRGHVDEIGFFHGGVVPQKAIPMIQGFDWRLSTHPLDCSRSDARAYIDQGLKTIEIEALSLCDDVLSGMKSGYSSSYVQQQVSFFQSKGIRTGLVLSPGLERSSFVHCCKTVDSCIAMGVSFVRIYPVCVYQDTQLERWWKEGRYTALTLAETVTILREMMDRLSEAKIEVIRVGRHDAHDGLMKSVAGPRHSNLRGLVGTEDFLIK